VIVFSAILRRFRRRRPSRQPGTADSDLERFFTDAEEARDRFQQLVSAQSFPKQILVIHGIGAVGKSSLLRMYRLSCRRHQLPVALVGGEEAPAPVDLLDRWASDLRDGGLTLPNFLRTSARYRDLRAKAEAEAQKLGQAHADATDKLTSAVAVGAVKVAASAIPFASPIVDLVGGEAVEAVLNLLRARLSKADFDFFLDPTTRFTDDFLDDLANATRRRRVVLMLDTFEQITALGEWLRDLVQRLPANALFVVAGRVVPDWDRAWPGWIGRAELIELKEMDDADVEKLVRQYYSLFGRGEPDDAQVADVVRFARGLPLAATTAVRLWVRYQLSDLQPVGPGAVADLADRLLEGVPGQMRPVFEAAAVLRSFNADSLGALLDGTDVQGLYDELRRWPFTRARREGLAVHDTMREVMNDALRNRSPEQFRQLNTKAAAYYERQLQGAGGEEWDRRRLEWLYHSIRADEPAGMRQFSEMAEELVRAQWVSRLRSLVNDANTYPLQEEGSRLWRRYYATRLDHLEGRTAEAEAEYRAIAGSDAAEPRLQAYALCDLGTILATLDRLAEPDGEARATETVQRSLGLHPLDAKLATNHVTLMNISNARADWEESVGHLQSMRAFAESAGDASGLIMADRLLAAVHGLRGDWHGYLTTRERYKAALDQLGDVPALQMDVAYFTWPLVFMGRYRQAQASSEEALALAIRLEEKELMITILESIALALGMQEDYAGAAERFSEAQNFYENFHAGQAQEAGTPERYIRAMLSFRGLVGLREGRLDEAEADMRRALDIKREIGDRIGTPEMHAWQGQLHELRDAWEQAEAEYGQVLDLHAVSRNYFECLALAGRARVHAARGRDAECVADLVAAERLADRYGYDDVLAGLRLCQAQLAWASRAPQWGEGFDVAARLNRQSLVHALRFNRFMLDEVLAGRPQGTVLRPVIPACLERGPEGRRLLESLGDFWRTGTNDLERPSGASVSPLPTGVALVEAERTARSGEPGAGTAQRTVLEQIEAALDDG
jgi:tetratricopeptide (TPR) repeat protein